MTRASELPGAPHPATHPGEHDGVQALLVDDNAFARSLGKRVLHAAGIDAVRLASSGDDAFALLEKVEPGINIVFCDLMMPGMDGVQIVRRLAELPTQPAFVFVSGASAALLNTVDAAARARGVHVLGFIQKPLTVEAVRRVLDHMNDQRLAAPRIDVAVTPAEIDAALAGDQFHLHFQPKVSLIDRHVAGFESLARWQHPEKGWISPAAFIAVAEQSGQIAAVTERIIQLALTQHAQWAVAGQHETTSINLSAHTLVDLEFPDRLARESERFGVNPGEIILEVTESGVFKDIANTLDILARLHMKGFSLSIDDFGTGYSSMEQLRQVPFSEMKIDRAFVNGASSNAKMRAILESSASLGRSLQMSVVAEGAETQEDWNAVHSAGVNLLQGYFVARPMPADQVSAWLARWTASHAA